MIFSPNTPQNPTNLHFAAGKQRMSIIIPVQAGGLKLEKLEKWWARRVKPIITAGGNLTSKVHRRRTVAIEMIGFPQDFTHSRHVGMHELLPAEPHIYLRHSNDVLHMSSCNPEEWCSLGRLQCHESAAGAALDVTHEDHTMPFISAKYNQRHSLSSSLAPARPTPRKVKRKSVPVDFLQDMVDPSPRVVKPASIHETNLRCSRVSIEESLLQLINYEQPRKSHDNQAELPVPAVGGVGCHFLFLDP